MNERKYRERIVTLIACVDVRVSSQMITAIALIAIGNRNRIRRSE